MIIFIRDSNSPWLEYIKDDPVRPNISKEFRIGTNKFVSVLINNNVLQAVTCVALGHDVPESVEDLSKIARFPEQTTTAVFYTIWSYVSGAGTKILFDTVEKILNEYPSITRFVTLSPKTQMAERFHLRNGAFNLRENKETINYEYPISVLIRHA